MSYSFLIGRIGIGRSRLFQFSIFYNSLQRMMKSGIVVRNTHYEVEDPFFRQWICQNIMQ